MTESKQRLTAHQRIVLVDLERRSRMTKGWVPAFYIGSLGACEKLVAKGYAERRETYGVRGGLHVQYRPLKPIDRLDNPI